MTTFERDIEIIDIDYITANSIEEILPHRATADTGHRVKETNTSARARCDTDRLFPVATRPPQARAPCYSVNKPVTAAAAWRVIENIQKGTNASYFKLWSKFKSAVEKRLRTENTDR